MPKKYYRERREFIKWLATPDMERDVNTQKGFAAKYGVHEVTVCEWRHDPEIIAEVNKLVDEHFADDYNEMTEALKREARRGKYNHLRMYFEMTGKFVPKQQVEVMGGITLYLPTKKDM